MATRLIVVPTEAGLALSGEIDLTTWGVLADALRRLVGSTAGVRIAQVLHLDSVPGLFIESRADDGRS